MKSKKKLITAASILLVIATTSIVSTWGASSPSTTEDREVIRAQMIASNPFHHLEVSMDALLFPKNLYILEGTLRKPSRLSLYYRNLVLSPSNDYHFDFSYNQGTSYTGRWFYESPATIQGDNLSDFDLHATLVTPQSTVTAKTHVEIVPQTVTTPSRLLAIGDSLTRMGDYLTQVETILKDVETVGTITYPGETIAREGRGGWTLKKYFTYIDNPTYLDSPFLFPTSVSGEQYKGNTLDWQKICKAHPSDKTYGGLQKIARGWKDTGDYLYDEKGYFKNPTLGDVMVDPTLPEGQRWIIFDGEKWAPMALQPTRFEFNFKKYMARFGIAYPTGSPTHVSILLGANDFGTFDTLMDMPGYLNYMQTLIDSIHAYDPNIKIIICTPTLGPNLNIITEDIPMYFRYDRNIKLATYYLLQVYDHPRKRAQNIYIAPLTLTLDTGTGYNYKTVTFLENGSFLHKTSAANTLHPNSLGHQQMGNTLASVLQKSRNDTYLLATE